MAMIVHSFAPIGVVRVMQTFFFVNKNDAQFSCVSEEKKLKPISCCLGSGEMRAMEGE